MKINETLSNLPAKTVRLSAVALSAAVMAVIWAILDEVFIYQPAAVIISSITSLVMLVAQFVDVKAKAAGAEVIDPTE